MENILKLKLIGELNEFSFFIPSYQRGYKWTEKEVKDLLNDIADFQPRIMGEGDEKTWYCLQPIVLKLKDQNKNEYEVIDGQQRLTTIYLILHYLNQDYVEKKRKKLFEISYQTRLKSIRFLKELKEDTCNYSNVDFFHISQAFKTISNWFETKGDSFDKSEFSSKLTFHSKIIWYETTEEDPIAIFTRINIGKIPLTNSELIKALFLNSSNFDSKNKEKLRLKQLEIANEWDLIENQLQNDHLWFFLTSNKLTVNRIEFIFDLMNDETDQTDSYSTFRFFSKKFKKSTIITVEDNWKKIKQYFQTFNEWYNKRELYHKIGYLLAIEAATIKELFLTSSDLSKSKFNLFLDKKMKDTIKNINIEDLQYSEKKKVRKILLLYNILTMLKGEKDRSFFPFDLYKNENWDIEHITSIKEEVPDKNKEQWLLDAKVFIDNSTTNGRRLLKKADKCDVFNDEEFKGVFEDIVAHFNSEIQDADINDISNLTLLDSATNRGYKNAVFPLKRKTIINRDKSGVFIPICTKNVFLKYFSEYPPKISFWTQDDRDNYENDLYEVLNQYIN
jgi:uncharacterized protein with ParB-like and HNH nuclease domain